MEQVSDLLDVEEGSLLLIDNDTGDLVFAYTIGPVGSTLRGQRLPSGTGLAGYVDEQYEFARPQVTKRLPPDELERYGATVRTLRTFIGASHDLQARIRDVMLPDPDIAR
jgi:hypothetical protein